MDDEITRLITERDTLKASLRSIYERFWGDDAAWAAAVTLRTLYPDEKLDGWGEKADLEYGITGKDGSEP